MRYVVTGATGFLGKKLVPELLQAGHDVVLIVRSKKDVSAAERVYKHFAEEGVVTQQERMAVIEGDVTDDPVKLADAIAPYGTIHGVWHLAANLSFKPEHRNAVLADNLLGTQQIARLCELLTAPLYFISTAFVHGQRFGVIRDTELVKPKKFNNSYEESKFLCEAFIREWGTKNKYLIFRPGILISLTPGQGSYFGYYVMAHALKKLRGRLNDQILRRKRLFSLLGFSSTDQGVKTPLLFPITDCVMDFVPVEWIVPWMRIIAEKGQLNTAFHMSNPNPIPIESIVKTITRAAGLTLVLYRSPFSLTAIYFAALSALGTLVPMVASFGRKIIPYRFYVTARFIHDMSRTEEHVGNLSTYTVSEQTLFDIAIAYTREESARGA